jgi:uncharacterized protein DUF3857/transglutaminase superfamily protein
MALGGCMRAWLILFVTPLLLVAGRNAEGADAAPPFEVLKSHVEVEIQNSGSFVESREVVERALTESGAKALRQITLSYTQGYQRLEIASAYTLKKDGRRINVDRSGIMSGFGATSSPGFQAIRTITVIFPNIEVGDEISFTTMFRQDIPWFGNSYSEEFVYPRQEAASDVSIAITSPDSMRLQIEDVGLTQDPPENMGGKTRRTWRFANATASPPESNEVDFFDTGARLVVSTFRDYRDFADVYASLLKGRADVTPEIKQLADQLVTGLKSDQEKVRALYEWVSLHTAYVAIVLGAGGFVPHPASEVLSNRYGDCKDHVILLEALLAAEGIESTPVLINAEKRYSLSSSPSPSAFNHLITYVPKLHLYLDSTARYAPYGVLPYPDAGKPVVLVAKGELTHTPSVHPSNASIHSVETVTVSGDGSIDGDTHVVATGAPSVELREMIDQARQLGDSTYFQRLMGPGVDASFGNVDAADLGSKLVFSAHYHEDAALNVPGPAIIPWNIVYKPFAFSSMLAGDLPTARSRPYLCPSADLNEELTIHLPPNVRITSLPAPEQLSADEITLSSHYGQTDPRTVVGRIRAQIDHPESTCSAAYYARVRSSLVHMMSALRGQILYQ